MASDSHRTLTHEAREREYDVLRAAVAVVEPSSPPLGREGVERLAKAFDGLGDDVLRALAAGRS
jgi:hypothetical protein